MNVLLNQLEAGRSVLRTSGLYARTIRTLWTRIVTPSLTPCGLAINDRPHGWSPRPWRGRVRDVARGGDHDAPSARGTGGRALLRRNPRVVPLSLGVPVLSVVADPSRLP